MDERKEIGNSSHVPFDKLTSIKGLAILLVLLVHLPIRHPAWPFLMLVNFGVAFFIITQLFIVFCRCDCGERRWMSYYSPNAFFRVAYRIVLPVMVLAIFEHWWGMRFKGKIDMLLNFGVHGPGSYYPWIYLLFYLTAPLCWWAMNRLNTWTIVIGGLLVVAGMEWLFSWAIRDMVDARLFYRALGVRYMALVPITYGMMRIMKNGSPALKAAFGLSGVVSFFLVVDFLLGGQVHLVPVPQDYGWSIQHWHFFIYMAIPYCALFRMEGLGWLRWFGRNSWVVFLVQMFWFAEFPFEDEMFTAAGWNGFEYSILGVLVILACSWLISSGMSWVKDGMGVPSSSAVKTADVNCRGR